MFGSQLSRLFAIKCLVKTSPYLSLITISVSLTLIISYMIKLVEEPVFKVNIIAQNKIIDFSQILDCIWFVLITMGTGN